MTGALTSVGGPTVTTPENSASGVSVPPTGVSAACTHAGQPPAAPTTTPTSNATNAGKVRMRRTINFGCGVRPAYSEATTMPTDTSTGNAPSWSATTASARPLLPYSASISG